MIGKITGRVDYRGTDHVLVDVQGVGYMVYCSERTLSGLPSRGGVVALYTDLLVREDNLQLFGFTTLADKEWHKLLTTVQGVGAKAALAIASTLGTDGVSKAIALGDVNAIKSAQGIGPKIAQRVITELKDKADFKTIRQIIADANVDDFDELFKALYERASEYLPGKEGTAAILINEHQYKANFRIDKEINTMSLIQNLINNK